MPHDALTDTDPRVDAFIVEGYRRMSPTEKITRVTELNRTIQQLALSDIRRRYPDAGAQEQALRLAARWLEPELMRKAFGWNVDEVGL